MSPEPTSSPPTMHTSSPNPNSLPPSPNVSSPSPPNEPDYSLNCFDRAARDEYNTWSIILELDDHSTPAVMLVTQDIRTRLEGILTLFPPLGGLLKLDTDGLPTLQYRQPPGSKLIDYEEEVFQQAIHDQLCGRLPDDLLERRFVPQLLYDKDLCLIPQTDLQTGKPPFTLKANFLRGETYHVFISFAVHRFLADNHTALLIISTLAGGWKIGDSIQSLFTGKQANTFVSRHP
nr:uncharacterized protein CTRU02_00617 [Colletotrichum truncatum]KAF6801868.1 hypothetical protein CTRU02_00617 [Colletotrichum truncatum]